MFYINSNQKSMTDQIIDEVKDKYFSISIFSTDADVGL